MKCAPVAQVLLCSDRASRKCSLGASTRLINAAFILPLWGKMEAVQKDCWYFVVLIFLPFLKVAVQQRVPATVRLEEGMVLHCLCPWDGSLSMVSWTKTSEKNPVAVFHPDFGVSFSLRFKGRVEFLKSGPMDGSISIRNVTHQDIGHYECSVQTFPRGPWTRHIQVEDLDEPPEEDPTEPAPTQEAVSNEELLVEQNSNLTIRCNYQQNGTVNQVILERMLHGQSWTIVGVCKKVEQGLVAEDYSDRGRVSCEDSLDMSLHLTDVTQEDNGFYRCTFNTDVGQQNITMQLTIVASGWFSLSLYMMYIYIGVGAAGLCLFIAIIIVVMRHRKRNKRTEYRVKLHPSQRQGLTMVSNHLTEEKSSHSAPYHHLRPFLTPTGSVSGMAAF
ncbi:CD226 antigen isoform X2 [Oreochromis niloticus]|uniref:CD226 antigen isoform X2 n=1 Tax=Oreochromis niloticus TaxID=8128 RepID=UPI000393FAE6|nr:CD226 antigen isoform X2 [Oreochromis niloticus]